MKILSLSGRGTRRLLAGAGAVVITASLSAVALAADAPDTAAVSSAVIKGCFNGTSGALRVLTPHSRSCGSDKPISWNQAGNGFAFTSTAGTDNKFGDSEADGQVVKKAGTYLVTVAAKLNIAAYTSGGAGFCALDLVHGTKMTKFVFEIFSEWGYPAPALNVNNVYPFTSSGMVKVTAKQVGFQFGLFCFDNSFSVLPIKSATWLVSPVSATQSAKVPAVAPATSTGHSTVGPAGFRPKPALKP